MKLESLGVRSSKQQLNDEVKDLYEQMTDPKKIAKRKRKEAIKQKIKDKISDYGL